MFEFLKGAQGQAPSRPRPPPKPKEKHWSVALMDVAISLLMRLVTWGMIIGIAALDIFAVAFTLIIAFQDDMPVWLVDFVKEYVFASQKHIRLSLKMLNLEGIADLMRDSLKALGMLWVVVSVLTLGATVLTRYVWHRRTRKRADSEGGRLGRKLGAGEVLVPLHDPLMLEMDDEFSRFVHLYAFYLDLRCRSADDASRVAQSMDALKQSLGMELVKLAESQVVQVKRDAAINALSDAARAITGGGIVGVILRSSDYHRLKKPESAIAKAPAGGGGGKPKMKLSTSWGAKPYQDVGAAPATPAATGPLSTPPAPAAEAPAEAAAPAPELKPLDPQSLVAAKARDVLAGLRG
jgi:hypothetical protein